MALDDFIEVKRKMALDCRDLAEVIAGWLPARTPFQSYGLLTRIAYSVGGAVFYQAFIDQRDDFIERAGLEPFLGGDSVDQAIDAFDICGAAAARMPSVLIDPHGQHHGLPSGRRVASLASVLEIIRETEIT